MNKGRVAAIVVTYNRCDLLMMCIERILSQTEPCDVLIVDNGSTDGTEEKMKNYLGNQRVHYKNTHDDLGSGGFQVGVEWGIDLGYEYLWIMDDDVQPYKDALSEFMKADKFLNGKWGYLSGVAYWIDGSYCKANIQKKGLFTFVNEKDYLKSIVPILMASYVSLFIRSEVVTEVGLPILEYFMYTDDYEYTSRISREYQGYMVTGSKVVHMMKQNKKAKFATEDVSRIYRYNYLYRNDVHCYRQYGLKGWIYVIAKDIKACMDILIHKTENKKEKIGIIYKGFKEGLKFNPTIKQYCSKDV